MNTHNIVNVIAYIYREMADNMRINFIPANSFQGMTKEYIDMWVLEPHSLTYYNTGARSNHLLFFIKKFSMFLNMLMYLNVQFVDLDDRCFWQQTEIYNIVSLAGTWSEMASRK